MLILSNQAPLGKRIRGVVEAMGRGRARKRAKRGQIPESIEQAIASLSASSAGQDEQLIDARNERSWLNDEKVAIRAMQQDLVRAQREFFTDQRDFMKEREAFLKAKAQFVAEKVLLGQKFGREVVITDEQVVYRNGLK